jgi:hypothetical protein
MGMGAARLRLEFGRMAGPAGIGPCIVGGGDWEVEEEE